MMRPVAMVAIACAAMAACDTPPASPVNAGAPAIAPAHASPDPPPARPVIVEDGGAGGLDGGGGGFIDAAMNDGDGGAGAGTAADGGAASSAGIAATTVAGSDAVMAELRPKFRACYIGRNNARPQGRLVFTAAVAGDGSVTSVASSQVQSIAGRVVTCMTSVMKAARFSATGHAATLELPVSFQSP